MKTFLSLPLLFLYIAQAVAQPAFAQSHAPGDAVSVDPTTHRVVLENEHVRVFRVLASPGRSSPRHTHPPTVLVSLERARFKHTRGDGVTTVFDLHPGDVIWFNYLDHSWELLSGDAHVIGIEVKNAERGAPHDLQPLPDTDALTVDPTHHHLVLENEHVRVFKAMAGPAASSPMHSHPPLVLVSFNTARVDVRMGDGTTLLHDFHPGQVLWIGGEHAWEVYAGTTQVVAVEVKGARKSQP